MNNKEKEPAICSKCKHCKKIHILDTCCCIFKCDIYFTVDYVDGHKQYKSCSEINKDGKCIDYDKTYIDRILDSFD